MKMQIMIDVDVDFDYYTGCKSLDRDVPDDEPELEIKSVTTACGVDILDALDADTQNEIAYDVIEYIEVDRYHV